jgi:uncharacterized membrane protein YhhN
MPKKILYLYILVSSIHLLGQIIDNQSITSITKPLLMPVLALYFIYSVGLKTKSNILIFIGLLFSQVGDTLLMYVSNHPNFFLAGLGAFLITQTLYATAFYLYENENKGFIVQKPYWTLPFLAYLGTLLFLLLPNIPSQFAPAIVIYACIITTMSIAACNLATKMKNEHWKILFGGVLLFLISDSLIAVNKFLMPLPYEGLLIMSTYIVGQFMIVEGIGRAKEWLEKVNASV